MMSHVISARSATSSVHAQARHQQVTHALLTRPPLTFESLGFFKSPFDLHVLSTPPAFILSQDQTLMLLVCLVKINSS